MGLAEQIKTTLGRMILSPSGWRGIFAIDGDEESRSCEISTAHAIIAAAAACVFAELLQGRHKPLVLVAADTRPTGKAVAHAVIQSLLSSGCAVKYAGHVAAPEIMAWARKTGEAGSKPFGFIYISASHNPVGHNGLKFGLADGGVLSPEKSIELADRLRSLLAQPDGIERSERLLSECNPAQLEAVYAAQTESKNDALATYSNFSAEVAWGAGNQPSAKAAGTSLQAAFKAGLAKEAVVLACDFNGCARSVSIDRDFFTRMGIAFRAINEKPGEIAHRIVPEGESLEPCRIFLEERHAEDPSFVLGYTPDCDGDRGNLVVWDDSLSKARSLDAQEVFALVCVAELAQLAWAGELAHGGNDAKAAVAVNDPTSLRVETIARAFGAEVFRAEVGEANVVNLARKLRGQGFAVPIAGEGSNGGSIIHPSAVRDPLNTALAILKLLAVKSAKNRPGLFELWCNQSNQTHLYHPGYCLSDIIASLPPFATTGAYDHEALLQITAENHSVLKNRYQEIFLRDWDARKTSLHANYGICKWEVYAYNGIEEKKGIAHFGDSGRGGLKICFFDEAGRAVGSIWMRGSATEPVFRVMADAESRDLERELIQWQRSMVLEADKGHLF
jgi:phosphoglucomutase